MDWDKEGGRRGSDAPYLPERYRKTVTAKHRRRLVRRIGIICAAIAAMLIILILVVGIGSLPFPEIPQGIPAPPASLQTNPSLAPSQVPTVVPTPTVALGSGLVHGYREDLISPDTAHRLIELEYPSGEYLVSGINLTDVNGRMVYVFEILPKTANGRDRIPIEADLDAATGNPYTPGQELAKYSQEDAVRFAGTFFSPQKPDQIRARYLNTPGSPVVWSFVFVKENSVQLHGTLDAGTGTVADFTRTISAEGRPKDPILSLTAAQAIAERTIARWNGDLPIRMTNGWYESARAGESSSAGRYVFEYPRVANTIPCDADGITIAVDSATGDITQYERRWSSPANAFSVTSEVLVTKRDATFAVLQNISLDKGSSADVQVLSAEIRWKDRHDPAITPRPGTIPLAWRVVFDDAALRAWQPPQTATGWVDAQTGAVMGIEYPR